MRIFISYARVDKPYCQQIVETLDVHEVWYDHRLHAGQKWWDEILRRLAWCDGFVYLLSPESIASEYCQKEYSIALKLGKHIFPVMIHHNTPVPDTLKHIQYADLSTGLDVKAVKQLLNAIYIAERENRVVEGTPISAIATAEISAPTVSRETIIDDAAEALDNGDFDRAVFLLKQAQEIGYSSKFIDVGAVLREAESLLERQAYLREAEREYRSIVALIKRKRTFKHGCDAFRGFRKQFPDYDPEGLAVICLTLDLPLLQWCSIPAGEVVVEQGKKKLTYYVPTFSMSKYPITNRQFQSFIDDEEGYDCDKWWSFSVESMQWHKEHPQPLEAKFTELDHPRGNVCYYEAVAFCQWLSHKSGLHISLPTEQQWVRAAQGDDHRLYPWGNKFDPANCNTREAKIGKTTPVTQFPNGASPFQVCDMAGNVWEWCATPFTRTTDRGEKITGTPTQVTYLVHGGSFMGPAERSQNSFHFNLNPHYRYSSIGFRIAYNNSGD